jgi:hypothetical protein
LGGTGLPKRVFYKEKDMADYLYIDHNFMSNPKVRRLIRKAGYEAFYGLIRILSIAAKMDNKGIFKDCNGDDIEDIANWHGEQGKLVNALISVGYLDVTDGVYSIHD